MIGCVVMAAGAGRRFGNNKLVASLGDGLVVERAIRAIPDEFDVVVVTRWPDVEEVARELSVACVRPEGPGRADSVRAGISYGAARWDACILISGDQPLVRPQSYRALEAAYRANPGKVVRLAYGGVPASPVLYPHRLFGALLSLRGHEDATALLKGEPVSMVEALDARELFDIDTRDDLRRVREHLVDSLG